MASHIPFVKFSGNGNDFIILKESSQKISQALITEMCHRQFGIGADGVLILSQESGVDARMRIFNADGGEAEMCANGIRCLVTYLDSFVHPKKSSYLIGTMNSQYNVKKMGDSFAIEMAEIKDKNKYDFSKLHTFEKSFYINTGVPHLVFLASDVKKIDIRNVAPFYRYHPSLPSGANVSFVEVLDLKKQTAYVRTFERGVEDETFSCGTGLTASALAFSHWMNWKGEVFLTTKGGQQKVEITDRVYYSGDVKFCFSGEWPLER